MTSLKCLNVVTIVTLALAVMTSGGLPRGEMLLCEGQEGRIECGQNEEIFIHSAFYGRINKFICMEGNILTDKCMSLHASKRAIALCNGKQSCTLIAVNEVFGDPCPGTYKYLRIRFVCDRKKDKITYQQNRAYHRINSSSSSDGYAHWSPGPLYQQKYSDVTF